MTIDISKGAPLLNAMAHDDTEQGGTRGGARIALYTERRTHHVRETCVPMFRTAYS